VFWHPQKDAHLTFVREYLRERDIHFWKPDAGCLHAIVSGDERAHAHEDVQQLQEASPRLVSKNGYRAHVDTHGQMLNAHLFADCQNTPLFPFLAKCPSLKGCHIRRASSSPKPGMITTSLE